jgi:ribosome-associated heat shock protein Hsp15
MTDVDENAPVQRLDKWLWFSRVLKSRTLAAQLIAEGKVRVNRVRITKPSQSVRAGDILTLAVRGRVLVVRILATGERRGPASEARQLYEVLSGTERNPSAGSAAKAEATG